MPDPVRPLTIVEALELASTVHRKGRLDAAEHLYRQILEAEPDCADALHFLGILHHQCGRSKQALALIRRAIRLQPAQPDMHSNLGNVLAESHRTRDAMKAYATAIRLDPSNAAAHNNLGACHRSLNRMRDAERCYRRAIECDPAHTGAYNNLGRLLVGAGRFDEAILCHAHAMELAPHSPDSRRFLVAAYVAAGDLARALSTAEAWARDEPESATARHLLAAISGRDVPARASDAFVETAFDRFAATFDSKLAKLDYRAPELVAAAVGKAYGAPDGSLAILDAGCGTGLCGPLLAPYGAALTGVDLSARMLEQARQRACYTALAKAELTGFLQERRHSFDLIVSADTLCYFGALELVLSAAAGALRPGGLLVFSVEGEPTATPFRLNPHGRYTHHPDYVEATLVAAGFVAVAIEDVVLRTEARKPVVGLVVTAKIPANSRANSS